MCDYSLHDVASRPAKVGDQLVTTEFWNTTTRGFCPVGEPEVAVCLLPGTEVVFESEVQRKITRFWLSLFKGEPDDIRHKVARFRQVNLLLPRLSGCLTQGVEILPSGLGRGLERR
jgi:hypothetical protein